MFGLTCTCCGADITAPQFYNGKAYGWTCIKKVNPEAKPSKSKALWVKGEVLSVSDDYVKKVVILFAGVKFVASVIGDNWGRGGFPTQDGVFMLIDNMGVSRYKSVTRVKGQLLINGKPV